MPITGNSQCGLSGFFETFPDEEAFIARSLDSETAKEMLIIPQMLNLLSDQNVKQWGFSIETIDQIQRLIEEIEFGDLIV